MKKSEQMEALLSGMTLEEKAAQLYGAWLPDLIVDGKLSFEKCREKLPHGIGHVAQFASSVTLLPEQLKQVIADLQRYLCSREGTKIPALVHEEAITGLAAKGAAFTPQMIGMSCTWNPQLVYENAGYTAENMKKLGCRHVLSPMMDVITDARWGRGEEGYGEDAYLVASFIRAFIKGIQEGGGAATAKHYAGYGVENQEMTFVRNETLYPFEVAVKEAKVRAIMPGYHTFHGVPCSASALLLNDILREEWEFDGTVVSDYGAVGQVYNGYHAAEDETDGMIQCLKAGTDVDFPTGGSYQQLTEAVRSGRLPEEYIDRAVRRVLLLKERVGLLDTKPQQESGPVDLDPPCYREQARKSAREAVVLLKNNGVLPLSDNIHRIALIGPNADSYYSLNGDYTWTGISEFFHRHKSERENPHMVTLLEGMQNRFGGTAEILYERGFDWSQGEDSLKETLIGDERAGKTKKGPMEDIPETDWNRALQLAGESDVILAAVGENRFLCGENCDREDIRLPGSQEEYVRKLCETGKPVVLVVFGGRPMAIAELAESCAAVIYAWYPGEEGGNALADLLSGDFSPSGKLTVTLPENNEQVPVFYRQGERAYHNRFPFGYGLTYTKFAYDNLVLPERIRVYDEYFDINFTIRNIGTRQASEISEIYFAEDCENRKLSGFAKTSLMPGEEKQVKLRFYTDCLAKYDAEGKLSLSEKTIHVKIGASVSDIRLSADILLTGETREFASKTHFFSEEI